MEKAKDTVTFNYPIPKDVHTELKSLSKKMGLPIKDIVINSLIMYTNTVKGYMEGQNDR